MSPIHLQVTYLKLLLLPLCVIIVAPLGSYSELISRKIRESKTKQEKQLSALWTKEEWWTIEGNYMRWWSEVVEQSGGVKWCSEVVQ